MRNIIRCIALTGIISALASLAGAQTFIQVTPGAAGVTASASDALDRVILNHIIPSITSAKPGDFGISGTRTLLMRSKSTNAGGIYYALTQATDVWPIVFLDFEATAGIAVEPHQRWATGLLVDRANVVGNIDLMNRGIFGSGHGWTIGWGWPGTA